MNPLRHLHFPFSHLVLRPHRNVLHASSKFIFIVQSFQSPGEVFEGMFVLTTGQALPIWITGEPWWTLTYAIRTLGVFAASFISARVCPSKMLSEQLPRPT